MLLLWTVFSSPPHLFSTSYTCGLDQVTRSLWNSASSPVKWRSGKLALGVSVILSVMCDTVKHLSSAGPSCRKFKVNLHLSPEVWSFLSLQIPYHTIVKNAYVETRRTRAILLCLLMPVKVMLTRNTILTPRDRHRHRHTCTLTTE